MKKLFGFIMIISILLSFWGCSKEEAEDNTAFGPENKMSIVSTIGMIGDVAQEIGGDRVSVYTMMGPGIDPHLYKAKTGDLERLNNADLILYNGIHLEAKMADVLEKLAATRNVRAVAETVGEEELLIEEGAYDPHVWFDVDKWKIASGAILEALISTDPEGEIVYQENYRNYETKLTELDAYVRERAGELPAESRILITAHDAFNYFGEAYGFEVRGLQGISTVDEAGTGDVRDLADFIADNRVGALFVETSVSPKSIEALRAAVNDRGWDIQIGGELFSDAMGDAGTPEGTYLGMVRHNIDTIVAGLAVKEE